jgi:DNA-binding IscR family transcriptional regulator
VEIAMTEAIRALDGPLLEMPCAGVEDLEHCDRPQPCSVHEVFQRVHESLNASLGATTLADVAATAGGPPYPAEVRRRRLAAHSATTPTTSTTQQAARNA